MMSKNIKCGNCNSVIYIEACDDKYIYKCDNCTCRFKMKSRSGTIEFFVIFPLISIVFAFFASGGLFIFINVIIGLLFILDLIYRPYKIYLLKETKKVGTLEQKK